MRNATAMLGLLSAHFALAAPVVDRSVPAAVGTLSREDLEKLPVGRRLEDLLRTCPARTIPTVNVQPLGTQGGPPRPDINCVQPDDIKMIDVYRLHNRVRAEFGARPLVWDRRLALQAASYGPALEQFGRPVHASRVGRETSRENLLQALPGTPVDRMVGVWIAERRNFMPGTFPNVSRTGNWADVGHYTQMVWPATTSLGCAVHRGRQFDWLICRYSPPGNQDGRPIGYPPTRIAQSPVININNPPQGPLLQDVPDENGANGGGENQDGGAVVQDDGGTRERPRQDPGLAPPNEGVSRQTGNCSASVIARVKIIERRDPRNPHKKRRTKESHNLGHGFTEIVIPFGWDADVDWAADPNPEKTFPDPGTMTASWAIVGQGARRNATTTGDYGHLQQKLQDALAGKRGWDREWGLLNIDPPNRPTVQRHRIEATWDPVPPTDPDSCPTDHDFTVTFAGEIPPPAALDTRAFVTQAGRTGHTGTRPRTPFKSQTRAFHEARPQPFFRNGNVVVPIGIYWDLPEGCCAIRNAERKVIQFARAAIHGPNGRQGKGWGLDITPDEHKRATDRTPGDHNPTYTSNPGGNSERDVEPGSGGGTRPNARDGNDVEQWDAPGMPKDLFDRLHAAQGASIYRQQFLSLLVCKPPGRNRVANFLGGGKVCQIAVTTVRWDFPGQAGINDAANYRPPTITVSFDVRDGNCIDLSAFLQANGLLDAFRRPDKEARNLEILDEASYEQLKQDVESWERAPFAEGNVGIPDPPGGR